MKKDKYYIVRILRSRYTICGHYNSDFVTAFILVTPYCQTTVRKRLKEEYPDMVISVYEICERQYRRELLLDQKDRYPVRKEL